MTEHDFKVTFYSNCNAINATCVLPVSTCHSSVRPDAVLLAASRPWKVIQRIYNVMSSLPSRTGTKIRTRDCVKRHIQ